jgi:hypothetical protein
VEPFVKRSIESAGLLSKIFGGKPPKLSQQVSSLSSCVSFALNVTSRYVSSCLRSIESAGLLSKIFGGKPPKLSQQVRGGWQLRVTCIITLFCLKRCLRSVESAGLLAWWHFDSSLLEVSWRFRGCDVLLRIVGAAACVTCAQCTSRFEVPCHQGQLSHQ